MKNDALALKDCANTFLDVKAPLFKKSEYDGFLTGTNPDFDQSSFLFMFLSNQNDRVKIYSKRARHEFRVQRTMIETLSAEVQGARQTITQLAAHLIKKELGSVQHTQVLEWCGEHNICEPDQVWLAYNTLQ